MSKGEKESVFITTKVRTKLKGDSWWQRNSDAQAEPDKEKPWLAEVRASRVNGAPIESSPVSSPTTSTPPPAKSDAERAPTSGYLIRGVFTKLDKSPSSSTTNGVIPSTTQFTKKPSESYKKIAPYIVRPPAENQESWLSNEEQEKRTEAASNVLKKSSVRQRSYVLSAAKKYESQETAPETSVVNSSPAFVARRVEIIDDDGSVATPAPSSALPPSPVVASAPDLKPWKAIDTRVKTAVDVAVNEPVAPKAVEPAPEPVREDPPPASVTAKEPFEDDVEPGSPKLAKPLPVRIPKCFQVVSTEPEPKNSGISWPVDSALVDLPPASPTPMSATQAAPAPASPVTLSPAPVSVTVKDPFEDMKPLPVHIPKCFQAVSTEPEAEPKDSGISWPGDSSLVDLGPASPAPASPVPLSPALASPVSPSPAPASPVPLSPAPATPVSPSPAPASPVPLSPAPASPVPLSPALASPAPASPVPLSPAPASPVPLSPAPASPVPLSPALASPVPLSPVPVFAATEILVKTEPETEMTPKPSQKPSSSVDTLTTLSDTLIAFDSSSTSFKDDEPVLAEDEAGSANIQTTENGVEEEPELSSSIPVTDDLLAFANGPEESAEPVPSSPGRWSLDLLSGPNRESVLIPAKSSGTLDLLADDVIPINTQTHSMQREEKQTDETAKETQSPTETVTTTTKTVIITDKSSADPFDPYPIGTTSSNRASDLLQTHSDISSNSASFTFMGNEDPSPETNISSNALESLADDVVPINTETTSLSTQRSWARTWETSAPQQDNTEESQEAVPEGQTVDQETVVMFERKSSENDSPWDRWTSPTVYTRTTITGGEEEEEEEKEMESTGYTETETVTTITTIREVHSGQQLAMDRYETYSRSDREEDQRVQTPEPEAKKGFVYVKEYVNASELSMHNARDSSDIGSDYLTSSSADYSYSSPSTYSSGLLSSTCNFCGEPVGNDAKITIEHLNINCHPNCFKCGVCRKPMGDLLYSMFLHDGKVHCEICYSNALD
ncbi:zinc finger protein 185 [Clinocottus analis]|uniref:zinc finger protein 185 n=1 Tax=Clinocottus analis TaxID=304258 RepID=UPI0035C090E2